MRVTANSATCVVSSLCVYRAPTVFDQDDDGRVMVLDPHPSSDLYEDVRRAVRGCPTQSLHIEPDQE